MTYRDLPYYEGIRDKTCHEYKLHENEHKNHAIFLHTFRKWSITWSQFILSGCKKHWLIHYSMVSTAIYGSREYNAIKDGGPSLDSGSMKKTSHRSSLLHTKKVFVVTVVI